VPESVDVGPPAAGVRLSWAELPAAVRDWVGHELGAAVVEAVTQPGGFSPGVAARLRCADGTRAFCKAVSELTNTQAPEMHRREAAITAALPVSAPVPRLLTCYDDGTWIALLFQDVAGRQPSLPWRADELTDVLKTLADLSESLTPSPLADASTLQTKYEQDFSGWRLLAAGPAVAVDRLDPWSRRHLGTLAVVDWPAACKGAAWFDVMAFAPSVAMQGGPLPEELLARHPAARGADPDAVLSAACALAGYFTLGALQPPPPGLPTVRPFQAAQARVARAWLARRTGWR